MFNLSRIIYDCQNQKIVISSNYWLFDISATEYTTEKIVPHDVNGKSIIFNVMTFEKTKYLTVTDNRGISSDYIISPYIKLKKLIIVSSTLFLVFHLYKKK